MAKARDLVRAYVEAGFTKIHLDASMACADDGELAEEEIADRAGDARRGGRGALRWGSAALRDRHRSAETGRRDRSSSAGLPSPSPTPCFEPTSCIAQRSSAGACQTALSRVIGIVVQPGVDFGNSQIFAFDRQKAASLSAAVADIPGAAFEAHSTDYQAPGALHDLVASHFAILKVGPELTAAYREAVVAMASIEEWLPVSGKSGILNVIDDVMIGDPKYWRDYVGDDARAGLDRLFGLSDRIRYYWPNAAIQKALKALCANIDGASGEVGLIAQFAKLPEGRAGSGLPLSQQIVQARVGAVVAKYSAACRPGD